MPYHLDLSIITITSFKEKLQKSSLPPSRLILKEDLDKRMDLFVKFGIENVKQLQQTLKKKEKFLEFSKNPLFSENYLTILLREINSFLPKPPKISDFPEISEQVCERLEKMGIKDAAKFYELVLTPLQRTDLAMKLGVSIDEIVRITELVDLTRIK